MIIFKSINIIFKNLENSQKKKIIQFFFFLNISNLFEIIGIGLIIPFVVSITSSFENQENLFYVFFGKISNFLDMDLTILILYLLLIFFLLKFIFLILFNFFYFRFISNINLFFCKKLFTNYLNQNYLDLIKGNSADAIRNISGEVDKFTGSIKIINDILANILFVLGIICILLLYNTTITLFVIIILLLVLVFFEFSLKSKLTNFGNELLKIQHERIDMIQNIFGLVREIRILNRESFFSDIFSSFNTSYNNIVFKSNFFNSIPKLIFELIFIIIVFVIILISYSLNLFQDYLSTLILFAAAFTRLMPLASRFSSSLQQINYLYPSIKIIDEAIQKIKVNHVDEKSFLNKLKFKNKISFKNVYLKYDKREEYLFKDLNIEIKKNTFVGILGPSGSGKTSMVNLLCGLIHPNRGAIYIDDIKVDQDISKKFNIGYMSQNVYLVNDTIKNNIILGSEYDLNRFKESINFSQISDFINSLPKGLDTQVGEKGSFISGGQLQRIGLARILYNNPDIIILDESTSSLDDRTEKNIVKIINKLSKVKTIIFISHKESALSYCNSIIKL